jgi:hypothetical protein
LIYVQLTLSNWNIFCCHPPVDDHCCMMIHMKEGNLAVLLAKYEEYLLKKPSKAIFETRSK